jgi:hypothetical protein
MPGAVMAGHSASKTRVNALMSPATLIAMHCALHFEVAGTSPAMTALV